MNMGTGNKGLIEINSLRALGNPSKASADVAAVDQKPSDAVNPKP